MQSLDMMGDYLGAESTNSFGLTAEMEDSGHRVDVGKRGKDRLPAKAKKEFPPPLTWLPERFPAAGVMRRSCTEDGRLILTEERPPEIRRNYFLVSRSDRRLRLDLVLDFDDDDDDEIVTSQVEEELVDENPAGSAAVDGGDGGGGNKCSSESSLGFGVAVPPLHTVRT